jgi:mRNA interferase MazF
VIKGDIVLIPFPFTDLTGKKNRPALILVSAEIDITVSFITTQIKWQENFDVPLEPTSENGLKKSSLIRLKKLATIDRELVLGRLGRLNGEEMSKVNENLLKLLKLDSNY